MSKFVTRTDPYKLMRKFHELIAAIYGVTNTGAYAEVLMGLDQLHAQYSGDLL